jgi:hypothetical protein
MLPLNKDLTPLIAGRTIKAVDYTDNVLRVIFADGSIMKIKSPEPAPTDRLLNHTVKVVRQQDDVLIIGFTDRSSAQIKLAEATSSVLLRDSHGAFEYAD